MNNRQSQILDIVTQQQKIEVTKLSELVGVSQVTVRKDLDALEEMGLVKREHGYAMINAVDDINNRMAYHYDIKRELVRYAAGLVNDWETVMIESGSCCALLAAELVSSKQHVTIITNSAFIAGYVRKSPLAKVILLGGEYQNESQIMVGPIVEQCAKNFTVDKLFIGVDGFQRDAGFTGTDFARADTVRKLAAQANNIFVVTESSKFNRQGVVSLLPLSDIRCVVTDDRLTSEQKQWLIQHGVDVRTVRTSVAAQSSEADE